MAQAMFEYKCPKCKSKLVQIVEGNDGLEFHCHGCGHNGKYEDLEG